VTPPVVTVAADAVSISQVAGQAVQAAGKGQQGAAAVAGPIQLAATATATAVAGQPDPKLPAEVAKPGQVAEAATPALPGTPADAPKATALPTPDTQHATPGANPQSAASSPQVPVPNPQGSAPAPPAAQAQAPHPTAPNHNPSQQDPGQQAPPQQQNAAAPGMRAPTPSAQHPTPDPQHPTPDPQHSPQSAVSGPQVAAPPAQPAPTAAPAQPAPPVAPAPPAAAPQAPVAGMRLEQAVETMHQVIRISQSSGITQARVQLHPQELGQVDIHLRSTPDGVVARVVADASQAAAVLRDGGDDLRRLLAQQGINLTRFDVGTAGQDQRQASFAGGGGQQQRGSRGNTSEDVDSHSSADHNPETTVSLPNGVLIDVLA
jgi:flagellar hook-length control protein FliK